MISLELQDLVIVVVVGARLRVDEQLLQANRERVAHGPEAPSALPSHRCRDDTADENPIHDALEPKIQHELGTDGHTDQIDDPEALGRGDRELHRPHRPRPPTELARIKHEG